MSLVGGFRSVKVKDAKGAARFNDKALGARVESLTVEDRRDGGYGESEGVRRFVFPLSGTSRTIRVRDRLELSSGDLYEVRTIDVQDDARRDSVEITAVARGAA